ncbi:hypothetical protein ColKHC_08693 [Colletotrichum higginsianum]|nr:hypothetical protein ColKHC_08693 [Colletotrichum higginsianum]
MCLLCRWLLPVAALSVLLLLGDVGLLLLALVPAADLVLPLLGRLDWQALALAVEGCDLVVVNVPLRHLTTGAVELGLLGLRVVAEIDSLCVFLALVGTPRLAPQPLLRQAVDGNLELHVVGQVLVEVGQTVGVGTEGVIGLAEAVASSEFTEAPEINDVQRRDVPCFQKRKPSISVRESHMGVKP